MLKKQTKKCPKYKDLWPCDFVLWSFFFLPKEVWLPSSLLWGLGHCQDMNVNFQFKNILWNTFSYFKIYLLFPWNRVLDFLILPFRSEISLNNWGLEKSYNTAVFSPSPRLSLHANTHWRQYNLGEVLFFFFLCHWELGSGGSGMRCAGLCLSTGMSWLWCNLECYTFLIKLGLVLFSHRTRKKNIHSEWHLFQEL